MLKQPLNEQILSFRVSIGERPTAIHQRCLEAVSLAQSSCRRQNSLVPHIRTIALLLSCPAESRGGIQNIAGRLPLLGTQKTQGVHGAVHSSSSRCTLKRRDVS